MLKRKETIIISAMELLEEEGISGVTTKNIARRQGVSEPALYRQFQGKQEIMEAMMEELGSFDHRIQNTLLESELQGREAILFYINRYGELYENYSELSTILLSMDVYFYEESTRNRMKDMLMARKEFLTELILRNRNSLSMKAEVTEKDMASMILGTMLAQILEWRLSQKEFSLAVRFQEVFQTLL